MVEADDVHVGEDRYSKTIFHKAGDDFDFFGLTHGFYLDALFGEDLLLRLRKPLVLENMTCGYLAASFSVMFSFPSSG